MDDTYFHNEKPVTRERFDELAVSAPACFILPNERHSFESAEAFDSFARTHASLGDAHRGNCERLDRVRSVAEKVGEADLSNIMAVVTSLVGGLDNAYRLIARATGASEADSHDIVQTFRDFISPRAGTVEFYRDVNFRGRFATTEGMLHIPRPTLGSNNDKLSSLRLVGANPTTITLWQHSWFRGDHKTFGAYGIVNEVPSLGRYGFNDKTSSWNFWS